MNQIVQKKPLWQFSLPRKEVDHGGGSVESESFVSKTQEN